MIVGTIKVTDDGPLLVHGDIEILDENGNPIEGPKAVALCRCGLSANKPFCDGTHEGKFHSVVRGKGEPKIKPPGKDPLE